MSSQISVDLRWKRDRHGDSYLVGNLRFPVEVKMDMSKGLVILIWPHPEDSDEFPQMVIKEKFDRQKANRKDNQDDYYED